MSVNYDDETLVSGTSGNDAIENFGEGVTIDAGAGDDFVDNKAISTNASINGGADNDYIYNTASQVTINGGDGDDTLENDGGENVTLNGDAGNDYISNNYGSDNNSINGGAGDDNIFNDWRGVNLTVTGGAGNDFVNNQAPVGMTYVYTSGNDTIEGFNENHQLVIPGTTWSTLRVDSDVIVKVKGQGVITLLNYWSDTINIYSSLDQVKHYNWIENNEDNKTITGTSDNDFIVNRGSNTTVLCGDGDDIVNREEIKNVSISGGNGNDVLEFSGANITVSGGAGNDWSFTWYGAGNAYVYTGGNDTINYAGGTENSQSIVIADSWSSVRVDDFTVLIKIPGKGTLTLENYTSDKLNIVSSLSDAKHYNIIQNDTNNKVITNTNNETFIINYGEKATISDGSGSNVIRNCNEDASISCGAGDDTVDTSGDDVTVEGGKGNDWIHDHSNFGVFKYAMGDGNDTIVEFKDTSMLSITGSSYSTQVSGGDVIVKVGNGEILLQGAAGLSTVRINDENFMAPSEIVTYNGHSYRLYNEKLTWEEAKARCEELGGHLLTITDSGEQEVIQNLLAEKGIRSGYWMGGSDEKTEGTWEWLTGETFDYFNWASGEPNGDRGENYLEINPNDGTWNDFNKDERIGFICEWDDYTPTLTPTVDSKNITLTEGNDTYTNAAGGVTIQALGGNDTIKNSADSVLIDGGAGNDSILGGSGKDTLSGGKDDDTLTGGAGADVFIYASGDGNDIITDYTAEDKIRITSGTASFSKSGDDVIATVGNGKITIKGGADKIVTYVDTNGEQTYSEGDATKINGKSISLTENYFDSSFNLADYDKSIQTVDASAVQLDIKITGNNLVNKIIGSSQDDTIDGGAGADYLLGGKGSDSIFGGTGDDTLEGGTGNDNLTGGKGVDVFVYTKGDGNDVINDYAEDDTISIKSDTVSKVSKSVNNIVLTLASKGKITITGGADKVIYYVDSDGEHTYPESVKFNSKGTAATLTSAYSKDEFKINDYDDYKDTVVNIDASAVNHDINITANKLANKITGSNENDNIDGGSGADSIKGGAGNDSIFGGTGNDTLEGGTGNDTLTGDKGADTFVYNKGDGNDLINDYAEDDTISIKSDTVSKVSKSGNNIVLTLASKGKITITGGADKVISYVDADGEHTYPESVKFNSKGTAATLTSAYSKDEFKINDYDDYKDTVVNIDASEVTHDINITANKLANKIIGSDEDDSIDGGSGADSINGGKGADTLVGNTGDDTLEGGTGNDNLTGGKGADTFVYNKGDGNDLINDYAEDDTISIKSDTVSKVSKSGNNIVLTLASKGKITITGGADKVISYVDSDGEHTYPESVKFNSKGTAATLTSAYSKDEFKINDYDDYKDTVVNIDASEVTHDINITANKLANKIISSGEDDNIDGGAGADSILGGKGNDSINGGTGNDTLEGGVGNDVLTGGKGADIFVYNKGDGKDIITDYAEEDTIQIKSDTVNKISASKDNIVFTLTSKGKITITGGADKVITYVDADGEHTYPEEESVQFNKKGTSAILTSAYSEDNFNISDYDKYKNSVVTIDASAVNHDINITGNKLANKIIGSSQDDSINGGNGSDTVLGGAGNDSLEGGKGNDNLTGSKGTDIFIYNNGDGNDVIADFTNEDKIVIASGKPGKVAVKNSDVIFKIGSGKITVENGADKFIQFYDAEGNALSTSYTPSNFLEDDEAVLTVDNISLSQIVENKSYSALGTLDTTLNLTTDKNYIPIITQSNRK